MDKILAIIFLLATILISLISNGKIELDKIWVVIILVVQIMSLAGYISLSDIEKRYKVWMSVLSVCAFCIILFFYIVK